MHIHTYVCMYVCIYIYNIYIYTYIHTYICIQVLETRAKAYGLTVDQYKRRNLMKAEITSHDVAGVVKALAGRAFLTVTGAQVCECACFPPPKK